jgi:uncharacterized protein Smg (DUF494 family)
MYERIIEIIIYVVSELYKNKTLNNINLEQLQSMGYTNSEISTALSWIIDRIESTDNIFQNSNNSFSTSFRILHNVEQELFTTEAWGKIIEMNTLGILSNEQIENLIDKAGMMGLRQIDTNQLKYYIGTSFLEANDKMMGGSRLMLLGNDTIN